METFHECLTGTLWNSCCSIDAITKGNNGLKILGLLYKLTAIRRDERKKKTLSIIKCIKSETFIKLLAKYKWATNAQSILFI